MAFNFGQTFQSLTNNLQGGLNEGLRELQGIGATITPIAKRTTRMVQEKLGNADEISELPQEYLDLEKKVDTLKIVYKKLVSVTSVYDSEAYDYPSNLRETFSDFSKSFSSKVQGLSTANSAAEAEAILNTSTNQNPKTLNHAISRVVLTSRAELQDETSILSEALSKIGETEDSIGQARLIQDELISTNFNQGIHKAISIGFADAESKRKKVRVARLEFDNLRFEAKNSKPEKQETIRLDLEAAEDEFVAATTIATTAMKNLIEPAESIGLLSIIVEAQLKFHKTAFESLSQLLPQLQTLKQDAEAEISAEPDDLEAHK